MLEHGCQMMYELDYGQERFSEEDVRILTEAEGRQHIPWE